MNSKDSKVEATAPGDSSQWTEEQKMQAGRAAAKRLSALRKTPAYRARQRRLTVVAHLASIVGNSGMTRAKVAEKADMKPAQLSRILGSDANLTLDTIGRVCDSLGWDFDVVFRQVEDSPALQCWQRPANRATLLYAINQAHKGHFGAIDAGDDAYERFAFNAALQTPAANQSQADEQPLAA